MAKLRNESGSDLVVPWLGHRTVAADQVVDVADADALAFLCQAGVWGPADAAAEEILDAEQRRVAADQAARLDDAVDRRDVDAAVAVLAEGGGSQEYLEQSRRILAERFAADASAEQTDQVVEADDSVTTHPGATSSVGEAGPELVTLPGEALPSLPDSAYGPDAVDLPDPDHTDAEQDAGDDTERADGAKED